jgi:hypothetical protein
MPVLRRPVEPAGSKQTLRLRASRSDFDPRVPPLKPTGGGWSNRWHDEGCGPVGLIHTQKVGIKYKKPVRYDWQKRISPGEQIGVTTLQICQILSRKGEASIQGGGGTVGRLVGAGVGGVVGAGAGAVAGGGWTAAGGVPPAGLGGGVRAWHGVYTPAAISATTNLRRRR